QPFSAVARDPPHRRLGCLRVQVVARHLGPVARERQRDPAADVRPGPGDQRHLPVQRHVHGSPSYGTLGPATAPGPANAVLVIRTPPESGHTIYDTFDDEKRVI